MKLIYNSFACFTYNLYFCSHYIISVYNKTRIYHRHLVLLENL